MTLAPRGLAALLLVGQGHRPAAEGSELVGTVALACGRQAWAKLVWREAEPLRPGSACLPGPLLLGGAPAKSAEHLVRLGRWGSGLRCCLPRAFPGGAAEDAASRERVPSLRAAAAGESV